MELQTAQNICNKMVCGGYSISLRKTKQGTISKKSWEAISSCLLQYYDCETVNANYTSNSNFAYVYALKQNGDELFSCNVKLF
jgi:hypothetical protein